MKTTPVEANQGLKSTVARGRLKLPLIECSQEALPEEEMTPDRVAEVLLTEETERLGKARFP